MSVAYVGKIGNWATGEQILLFLPHTDKTTATSVNTTINIATMNYPWFDNTYTLFCSDATKAAAFTNIGFTQVKLFTETTDIYIAENKYIRFTPGRYNNIITGYKNGTSKWSKMVTNTILITPVYYSTQKTNEQFMRVYNLNIDSFELNFYTDTTDIQGVLDFWDGIPPYVSTTDPYEEGGESNTGGGEGDLDNTSDDIEIPDLPQDSASDSRFITLFNPSLAELQSLASYMWSTSFDLDTFKKLFANPMDCILGLSIVPVEVPNGGSRVVTVGNISTGVSMNTAASQYVEVDCGTLNVNEYWGAYLDYEPYTKAEIYLPYIGTHAISVDDIMNKSVHVVYHVDILSGACAAYVEVDGTVLYQFIGQCASSIPVTGRDWTNMINGVLSIAGAIGSMVATGGASAPMATGVIASTAVNMMKPNIEKSGAMSGTGGLMAVQTPYIILTRPRQAIPAHQNTYMGYPAFITVSMDDLEGYTEVEHVHLEGMSATANEVAEIESILLKGVVF